MANPKGIVTRKDMFSDDAMNFGDPLVAEFTKVTKANDLLLNSVIQLNKEIKNLKVSQTEKDYITAKQAATLETQKAIDAIKIEQAAVVSLESKKRAAIATIEAERKAKQSSTNAEQKSQSVKRTGINMTIEERVQLQVNNKILRQEAMERLGLVSAYTKLNNARTDSKNRLRDLIATERASVSEIKKAQREYDVLDQKVRKADRAVGDFTKNVGNYKSAFSGFAGGIGNLLGAFGIIGGVSLFASIAKDIFATTKEMQSLDNALKQVTDTNAIYIEQQLFLTRIAEAYGAELKGLTKQYTQFYVAAKDKLASTEIQAIFESVTKAGASMGLSVQSQERAFLALNQMMSKGTIQAEELRGQLGEALPGALGIMAKAVGVTEKELGEMMKKGDLLASDVLPKFAKQLEITYGIENKTRIESLAASQSRFNNTWTELIVSIDSGGGRFSKFLMGTLDILSAMVDTMTKFNQTYASVRDKSATGSQLADAEIYKGLSPERTKAIAEQNKKIAEDSIKDLNNKLKASKEFFEKINEISILNVTRMGKIPRIRKEMEDYNIALGVQRGRVLAANAALQSLKATEDTKGENITIEETDAQKAKRAAANKKAAQDRIDLEKRLLNSLYELQKQRLEQTIRFNDEIVADELESDEIRLQALENSKKKQEELLLLTKDFLLKNADLTANDRIRIEEDYSNKIIEVAKKTQKEIDRIILFDEAKYTKDLADKISKQNEAMNAELEAENRKFIALGDLEKLNQKDRESAIEAHEKTIFEIKKRYAIEALKLQIANLESELIASDALPEKEQLTAEKRQKIAETLSKAKLDLSEVELSDNDKKNKKTVENERLTAEILLEISQSLSGALSDLANALFSAKIQSIDDEIDKNNEYYAAEIEKAGNNEAKKTLLEQERAKKEKKLQEEKRKEQRKQAIFEKAAAVAQAAISTALAVLNALNTKPFLPLGPIMATVAGALGAIQIAAILATPIPKYKLGRKGGKAETAIVGDGGVAEVIERKSGGIEITPATDTLVKLQAGDNVHSSVDAYLKLQKAAILTSIDLQGRKVSDFQASQMFDRNSDLMLKELKENTRAIKSQKNTTVVNMPKIDMNHEYWKFNNKRWN